MLTISEAVALSALARTESRGAHSRIDFPNYDPVWAKKHNVIVREGGKMTRHEIPVDEMPDELKQIHCRGQIMQPQSQHGTTHHGAQG